MTVRFGLGTAVSACPWQVRSSASTGLNCCPHFGCTRYHPLFVFNQLGDVERCAVRSGNVHSVDGWRAVLEPVIAPSRGMMKRLYLRGDAAFANPDMYERIGYTIRLPANTVLQNRIGDLLKRPVGRPRREVRR